MSHLVCFSMITQRKERLLKKQHRQALLLDNFLSVDGLSLGRSLRDRKPVTYTFGKIKSILLNTEARVGLYFQRATKFYTDDKLFNKLIYK